MVGPGLVVGIPFVHNVMVELITEQFVPLPPLIRLQPMREFASQINFQVVDLEKALVGVADYKGLLVNSCAAVVRTLVVQPDLSDDDVSARLLEDESLQQRAEGLGVRLLRLNVSTSNLTEPAQLAHAFRQEGIMLEGNSGRRARVADLQGCLQPRGPDGRRRRRAGCVAVSACPAATTGWTDECPWSLVGDVGRTGTSEGSRHGPRTPEQRTSSASRPGAGSARAPATAR